MAPAAGTPSVALRTPTATDSPAAESSSTTDSSTPLYNWHKPGWLSHRIVNVEKPKQARSRFLVFTLVCAVVAIIALGLGFGIGFGLKKGERYGPLIDLGYAKYKGNYLDNGVSEFLRMRYAKEPTGDLRFRAPAPPDSQEATQDANEFGAICLSEGVLVESIPAGMGEDCLFVNVWGPTNATADRKLPVLVFIQGGGYQADANANWNGTKLVETSGNNLVFVNFNYRVGLFGFLGGEEVRKDGDLNAGLLDQRFLLKWVQTHISKFGGDPNHVVIQGVSAGAGSVALHLAAYGGRNDSLFHGAISESMFHPAYPQVADQEPQLKTVLDGVGCTGDSNPVDCLRGQNVWDLQTLNTLAPFPGREEPPIFYWTPSVDGEFLTDLPYKSFELGKIVQVPVLFGTCTNEGSIFAPNVSTQLDVQNFFLDNYPKLNISMAKNITTTMYPREAPIAIHQPWFPSASRAYGESTFICPSNIFLEAITKTYNSSSSAPVWSYRFNVLSEQNILLGIGVPHVMETSAVFGPDAFPGVLPDALSGWFTYNAGIIPITMNYWISFVRSLDPNKHKLSTAPSWDRWGDTQQRLVLQIDMTGTTQMETVDDGQKDRCEFWKNLGPSINL